MNGPNAEAITIKDVAIAHISKIFCSKIFWPKVPLKELLMPCIIPNKLNGITKKLGLLKKSLTKPSTPGIW